MTQQHPELHETDAHPPLGASLPDPLADKIQTFLHTYVATHPSSSIGRIKTDPVSPSTTHFLFPQNSHHLAIHLYRLPRSSYLLTFSLDPSAFQEEQDYLATLRLALNDHLSPSYTVTIPSKGEQILGDALRISLP